jgi:transposase
MKWFNQLPPVYLYRAPVDFRKAVNGLSAIVEEDMGLSPYDGALYLFCNRNRDRLKVLHWDKTGFVLWYKRLEKERFRWPRLSSQAVLNISPAELESLLSGLSIERHKVLNYKAVSM